MVIKAKALKNDDISLSEFKTLSKPILTARLMAVRATNTDSYCHEIKVSVGRDGSINPSSISFGNQGDRNITRLTFDLTDINIDAATLKSDYQAALIFNPGVNGEDSSAFQVNISDNKTATLVIPTSITANAGSYQLIFGIFEIDADNGNISTEKEKFISAQFSSSTTATDWIDDYQPYLNAANLQENNPDYITKTDIHITPNDTHYSIAADSTNFGNKQDIYVKRVIFGNSTEPLEAQFSRRYAIFMDGNTCYVYRMRPVEDYYCCWVPKEITMKAGSYQLFVVAETDLELTDANFQRWVSNTLTFSVSDNFLNGDIVIHPVDGGVWTVEGYSLLTQDNVVVNTYDTITSVKVLKQNFNELQNILDKVPAIDNQVQQNTTDISTNKENISEVAKGWDSIECGDSE